MSRDIRSFFTTLPKKPNATISSSRPSKKRTAIISDDEDIVPNTPSPEKMKFKQKRRKIIHSDSEGDEKPSKAKPSKKPVLKPVSAADVFGTEPVKQSVVVSTKKSNCADDFEKTLQQLDEDFSIDINDLDKTIEEAIHSDVKVSKRETKKNFLKISSLSEQSFSKGRKVDDFNDSGLDPDQERHERKRHSAVLYQKYLNRSGPAHKGEKELPKGKPDCLKNLCFLKTGVLDSMEKDDMDALVKEHGGRTVNSVSKKVNYLVVGDDPGPAKLEKARSLGIKEINEDELMDMILVKSGMKPKYVTNSSVNENLKEGKDLVAPEKKKRLADIGGGKETSENSIKKDKPSSGNSIKKDKPSSGNSIKKEKLSPSKTSIKARHSPAKTNKPNLQKLSTSDHKTLTDVKPTLIPVSPKKEKKMKPKISERSSVHSRVISSESLTWTDKYKPADIKSIIGQQGDKSNMKKLIIWLKNWHANHSGKNKPKLIKPSPWAKNDDGAYFKCALLSGPPGVGKTTTATLVTKELGLDIVEFNASDTRSKKFLHEEVSQLLNTKSLATYFKDGCAPTSKHVLLMDEVDGMAGNEDRGGMQELIALIKNTRVPIICMCNDRQHPKIRSLVNYCLDLRFVKPRIEQIKGAMMSICFKEGLKISPEALTEVINGTGMDIRQTLNNLSMWSSADKNVSSETAKKEAASAKKDTIIGPWEVIRKVFSEDDHKSMSLADKSKLFFYDYSIGPLFVQENYLQVVPHCPKNEFLERVAAASDCISMGDVIDKKIRSTNNWSLLESQAMFSSVLPGYYMEGHMGGQINFPVWLGKNSKRGKFQRLLSELQAHMRTSISGSKLSVNLEYIYHLRNKIVRPLAKEGAAGIEKSLEVMKSYNLLREDLDSILELCQWPKQKDPMAMVDSKIKAAFTRAYNKDSPVLPYAVTSAAVKKKVTVALQEVNPYDEEEMNSEDEPDDITKDAMIKEKKKVTKARKKDSAEPSSSKKPATSRSKNKKMK